MWQLKNIHAENICAFRELDFSPLQGCTTLIFGNNLDNDGQGSNGSGKSALIETIAITLTGESLRIVNADEIINDACDDARIVAEFCNYATNDNLVIERVFSRNSPQSITITLNDEAVVQPTILEYNRYILSLFGLSKSDIFSSYILSKHKYTSFLNASDRAKKELINRFSNGNMVDESIAVLKTDIADAKERLFEAEKRVAHHEGRVSTVTEQIDAARAEETENVRKKDELIQAHQEAITRLRSKIRESKATITKQNTFLDSLDEADAKLRELEDGNLTVSECYAEIVKLFLSVGLPAIKNYVESSNKLHRQLEEFDKQVNNSLSQVESYRKEVARASDEYGLLVEKYEEISLKNSAKTEKLKTEIDEATKLLNQLSDDSRSLRVSIADLNLQMTAVETMIAGSIECPKCHHRFVLQSDKTIDELQKELLSLEKRVDKAQKAREKADREINETNSTIKTNRRSITDLDAEIDNISDNVRNARLKINNLQTTLDTIQKALNSERATVERLQHQIAQLRQSMFDEAFDKLDVATRQAEGDIETANLTISNCEGNIATYQESIAQLNDSASVNTIESLENRKTEYEKDLNIAISEKDDRATEVAALEQQEARFIDFKTHLANAKIEALGQITNEFLEAIGSDIRISFSGYTILRSGKIRDKISISLLRDGIDCGSFAKFSAGEQCRVNLASILALHKLTNVNCNDEKGLDLLILDEILDATDEAGLASMFDALNSLQITSMVVSHGQIAEAYPYRLTVTKQNGISTINGNEA